MKKSLLTMAAALALVSCTQDDLLLSQQDGNLKGTVGVNVFVPTATRGLALNSVDNLIASGNGFDLISYYNLDDNYISFMGTSTYGLEFKHDGSAWDYANRNEVHFWQEVPEEAADMKFFAISPTLDKLPNSGVTADGLTKYNIASDEQSITYVVPTAPAEQVDLMFAQSDVTDFGPTSTTYNNGVPLHFHHALSQIVFKARIAEKEASETDASISETVTAYVGSIKLANVYGGGVFDMDKASAILGEQEYLDGGLDGTDYANNLWNTDTYTQVAAYTIDALNNNTGINWIAAKELTSGVENTETAMLLIPQQLSALNLDSLGNSANQKQVDEGSIDLNSGAYLEVSCRIEFKRADDDVVVIVGDKNVTDASVDGYYAKLYIPLNTNWNPGYKYVYTLVFSADSGDPVKAEVVSVDEWNTATYGATDEEETGDDEVASSLYELIPTGLYSDGTNILIGSKDDLIKASELSKVIQSFYYVYTEQGENGKYPVYIIEEADEDGDDGSIEAPEDAAPDMTSYSNMLILASYKQTENIDLERNNWIPLILNSYDGNNYSISNFKVEKSDLEILSNMFNAEAGSLFYVMSMNSDATIKDLYINNAQIGTEETPIGYAAAIAAYVHEQNGTIYISNCKVDQNSKIYGESNAAGIVTNSFIPTLTISDCTNNALVTSNGIASGITGVKATISNCLNYATVTGTTNAAGIVYSTDVYHAITNCHNYGSISGACVGGIVSTISSCEITASHNEGTLTGTQRSGGIVGDFYTMQENDNMITLTGCYNVNANVPLVAGVVYAHNYDNEATDINVILISCYNIADTTNAMVGEFYSVAENPNKVRHINMTLTNCYYTLATSAYTFENTNGITTPETNKCIKLESEESTVTYDTWHSDPLTAMNSSLINYFYESNNDNNHPLKLNSEP